jgi:hypothetical protein
VDILESMADKPAQHDPSPAGPSPDGSSPDGQSAAISSVPDLLLDQIDALRVLRAPDERQKEQLLEQIGAHGAVEKEIVRELSAVRPLRHPDRFEEAHRLMMRSIEVLDRNGSRPAAIQGLAFLKPIAQWLVQQATRWIVRSHLNRLLNRIGGIYERREASSGWSTPEHAMLRRARLDVRRVQSGMNGKALGLPAFLLGGAFITSIASTLQSVARSALDSTIGVVLLAIAIILVLLILSWVALYSASVARRRIRLSSDQQIRALWETIGAAGKPPRDESLNFAVYAIILLVLSWIVIPLAIWLAITA